MDWEHNDDYLIHYGVKGQRWGERRYRNEDGTLTAEGREHYGLAKRMKRNKERYGKRIVWSGLEEGENNVL